jgi:hypothetical protein
MELDEEERVVILFSEGPNERKIRYIILGDDNQIEIIGFVVAKACRKYFDDALFNTYHKFIELLEASGHYGELSGHRTQMKRLVLVDAHFMLHYSKYLNRILRLFGRWRNHGHHFPQIQDEIAHIRGLQID